MARTQLREQEWQTVLSLTDWFGIPVRKLLDRKVRFTELKSAGHRLGRAVTQITTEPRLLLGGAKRLPW